MIKIFYDHLVLIEEVVSEIEAWPIEEKEKGELISLVDQTLHQHTLDVILTHLPQDKHAHFLSRFKEAPHDPALLTFLKTEITIDIETEIRKRAQTVKKEILAEIKKAKK